MKKTNKLLYLAITFALLIVIGRFFSWYTSFTLPTSNMAPTYQTGAKLYASSLLPRHRYDVVCYKTLPCSFEPPGAEYSAIGRLMATENDTIEIKNGCLYINNKIENDTIHLGFLFVIKNSDKLIQLMIHNQENKYFSFNDSSTIANLSYTELFDLQLNSHFYRHTDTSFSRFSAQVFGTEHVGKNWRLDNFGPLIVPKGKVFIIGDNRSNSIDSRLRGFIDEDKVFAKVFY